MTSAPRSEIIIARIDRVLDSVSADLRGLPLVRLVFGPPVVTLFIIFIYVAFEMSMEYMRNPNRHWYEFAVMAPVVSFISLVVASWARFFSYLAMLMYVGVLLRRTGRARFHLLLLATPLLGLLTWYGYDHFVPDYRWYTDESLPYVHGLTLDRFLKAWGFEVAIALGYWWLLRNSRANSPVPS